MFFYIKKFLFKLLRKNKINHRERVQRYKVYASDYEKRTFFAFFKFLFYLLRTPVFFVFARPKAAFLILKANFVNVNQFENYNDIVKLDFFSNDKAAVFFTELSRVYIANKEYVLALKSRDLAANYMLHSENKKNRIKAFFYFGESMKEYSFNILSDKYIKGSYFKWLVKRISFKDFEPFLVKSGENAKRDQDFLAFIKGKTVAVVGPVEGEIDNSKEIESFDVVIRINYLGIERASDSHLGRKTHVAYYNGEIIEKLSKSTEEIFSKLKFGVFKKELDDVKVLMKNVNNYRYIDIKDNLLIHGSLNAVPNAVLDVIGFLPSKIKVFGTDLFLTNNYRQSYLGEPSRDVSQSFIIHDPISQYKVLSNLYRNGLIEGDAVFTSIMEMGVKEYVVALEKAWKC